VSFNKMSNKKALTNLSKNCDLKSLKECLAIVTADANTKGSVDFALNVALLLTRLNNVNLSVALNGETNDCLALILQTVMAVLYKRQSFLKNLKPFDLEKIHANAISKLNECGKVH
jgi:hypothetical protein